MRKQPNVESLAHRHANNLTELIQYLIEEYGVSEKVSEILYEKLPFTVRGLKPEELATFIACVGNEKDIVYCRRLVINIKDLANAHPFDLFKIIVKLLKRCPQITENIVKKRIQHITTRNLGTKKQDPEKLHEEVEIQNSEQVSNFALYLYLDCSETNAYFAKTTAVYVFSIKQD